MTFTVPLMKSSDAKDMTIILGFQEFFYVVFVDLYIATDVCRVCCDARLRSCDPGAEKLPSLMGSPLGRG